MARDGHFFDKAQKILVAVSGGKDSMALLDCLLATKGRASVRNWHRPCQPSGLESDEEEAHLKSFAQQENIPIYNCKLSGFCLFWKRPAVSVINFWKKDARTCFILDWSQPIMPMIKLGLSLCAFFVAVASVIYQAFKPFKEFLVQANWFALFYPLKNQN